MLLSILKVDKSTINCCMHFAHILHFENLIFYVRKLSSLYFCNYSMFRTTKNKAFLIILHLLNMMIQLFFQERFWTFFLNNRYLLQKYVVSITYKYFKYKYIEICSDAFSLQKFESVHSLNLNLGNLISEKFKYFHKGNIILRPLIFFRKKKIKKSFPCFINYLIC